MADWVAILGASTGPPAIIVSSWRFGLFLKDRKAARPKLDVELTIEWLPESGPQQVFHVRVANSGGQVLHLAEVVLQATKASSVEVALKLHHRPVSDAGPFAQTAHMDLYAPTPSIAGRVQQFAFEAWDFIDGARARQLDPQAGSGPAMVTPVRAIARTGDRQEWRSPDVMLVCPRVEH